MIKGHEIIALAAIHYFKFRWILTICEFLCTLYAKKWLKICCYQVKALRMWPFVDFVIITLEFTNSYFLQIIKFWQSLKWNYDCHAWITDRGIYAIIFSHNVSWRQYIILIGFFCHILLHTQLWSIEACASSHILRWPVISVSLMWALETISGTMMDGVMPSKIG